jgi:hypothetical protein
MTYKYPKLKIASNESFVLIFTCKVHTIGMGSDAKSTSVRILMTELNIPIAVKRLLSKHFAFGSLAWSQLARMGTQENNMVCNKRLASCFAVKNHRTYPFTRQRECYQKSYELIISLMSSKPLLQQKSNIHPEYKSNLLIMPYRNHL